jgi:hypothetical protein
MKPFAVLVVAFAIALFVKAILPGSFGIKFPGKTDAYKFTEALVLISLEAGI